MKRMIFLAMVASIAAGCSAPAPYGTATAPAGFATGTTPPTLAADNVKVDVVQALNLALEVEGWFPPSRSEALESQPTRVEEVSLVLPSDPRLSGLDINTSNPVWLVILQGAWQRPDWLGESGAQSAFDSEWMVVETIRVFVDANTGKMIAWDTSEVTDRSGNKVFASPSGGWIATFNPPESRLQIAGQSGIFNLPMPPGREVFDASWSPDEATLVAALTDRSGDIPPEIWIARESDGTFEVFEPAVQPFGLMEGTQLQFDTWSPDGRYLLFWAGPVSASIAADGLALWSLNAATGQPNRLSSDALMNTAYRSWAPEGGRLIFTDGGYRSALVNKRLTLADLDTGGIQVLVPENQLVTGAVAWSPGGDLVAYAAVPADQTRQAWAEDMSWDNPAILARRIYLLDLESGAYLQLNDVEAYQDAPRWSADGEVLYFVQMEGQEAQVMVADPESGQERLKAGCSAPLPETAGYYGQVDWSGLYSECFSSIEPETEPNFDFGSVIPWSEVEFFRPTETDQIERSQLRTGGVTVCGLSPEEAQTRVGFNVRLPSGLPEPYHLIDVCYITGSQAVSISFAAQGAGSIPRLTILEQATEFDERVGLGAEVHRATAGDLPLEYVYGGWLNLPGTEQAQWDDRMVPHITLRFRSGNLYIQLGYTGDCREDDGACLSLTQLIALVGSLDG